jgi:DNA (cytosine-5)-methyltransferase 1
MKILNLYAGIGGNRKLWGNDHDITAIEYNENIAKVYQDYFPNDKIIVTDAHQYLLDHYEEFDFIWSSPPCPSHSKLASFRIRDNKQTNMYPDMSLYQQIIFLKAWFKGKYCIENVIPYYEPLIKGTQIERHIFWTNFKIGKDESFNKELSIFKSNRNQFEKILGYDLSKYKLDDKHKCLKNCVFPDVGKYILDKAMNVIQEETIPQGKLF